MFPTRSQFAYRLPSCRLSDSPKIPDPAEPPPHLSGGNRPGHRDDAPAPRPSGDTGRRRRPAAGTGGGSPRTGRPVRGGETRPGAVRAGRRRPHRRDAGDRAARPLAGVPSALPGQQVLPDHLPGRRTAAGLPRLPGRPAATPPPAPAPERRRRVGRPDPAGRVRAEPPRLGAGRRRAGGCLYPVLPVALLGGGGGYDAFLDRQGLLVGWTWRWAPSCCSCCWRRAAAPPAGSCPRCACCSSATATTAGLLPQSWPVAHAGLDFGQLVDAFYNSDSGFYGTPLDVAASYIVLFTIYGAVLDLSGAGRFFVELSAAAFRRSRTAAGRTAVASGFLLGTVSGSGAATTVSIGAVTWPILRRAGYPRNGPAGCSPPPASARSSPRPRSARRPSSSPSTSACPTSRCSAGRPCRPSSTTWASCSPWRSTPGAPTYARWSWTPARRGGCWPASGTTSSRCS